MLENQIFQINSDAQFAALALEVFQLQYNTVPIYRKFCEFLKVNPVSVKNIKQIPFLPIEFFKQEDVIAETKTPQITFFSSGTTGQTPSKHLVSNLNLYEQSFRKTFQLQYGESSGWTILALLPSYLEREDSSLVYMVDKLIKETGSSHSGFYLNDMTGLVEKINYLESVGEKTMLLGVSYALLDLVEQHQFDLKHTVVMETGGMKGRRKEMVKEELHEILKRGFGVAEIHSEYGMTEILSQAYSKGNGDFVCPPWMKVLIRDPEDALSWIQKSGGINIIDLANLNSCSFIATQDLGKLNEDGSFQILGRFDHSDIRGCNLMVL
ncbi:MAG: acyl transferase [Flavobacteriaceae bacterium]|nr:acyl transferase [Flavobacteriaceae bacterium]